MADGGVTAGGKTGRRPAGGIAARGFPVSGAGRSQLGLLLGVIGIVFAVLAGLLADSAPVSAHAYLTVTDPAGNALVARPPAVVTMTFSERLEPAVSRADLYDQAGQQVPGTSFEIPEPYTMILSLPPNLADGSYSVVWTSLSIDDGHTASGYTTFTVGTEADVATVVLPPLDAGSAPPQVLVTIARAVTYLGLAILLAVWPIWRFVLRPALAPVWELGPAAVRRARALVLVGLGLALAGSIAALILQAITTGDGLLTGLGETLLDTRFGQWWLVRVALLIALGLALNLVAPWWFVSRRKPVGYALFALGAVAIVPFSLVSHAAAQPAGRAAAVANDMVHGVAASLWLGGIIVLLFTLIPVLRSLSATGRQVVLGRAVPRFSTVALCAWAGLVLTGFYAAWLQVGNLHALFDTDYGLALVLKLTAVVGILAVAAFNLLVMSRLLRSASAAATMPRWTSLFGRLLVVELVLGLAVLGVTGQLTSTQPARDVLDQQAAQVTVDLELGDRAATLGIAPGLSGLNHFQLRIEGDPLPAEARAILRVVLPSATTELQDIDLERIAGNAFEWHGSEIAIPGDWSVDVILRQPGVADLAQQLTIAVPAVVPDLGAPGEPPRFGPTGISGLILLMAGVVGVVVAAGMRQSSTRRETAGLAGVGLAVGIVLLVQGQLDPALSGIPTRNPVAADERSITAGRDLWASNCLMCHGPEARGDGPQAAALDQPPPDLTSTHQRFHTDQELFDSIANGVPGTAMPAFGDQIGETGIWDLINYLHLLQDQSDTAFAGYPGPGPETGDLPAETALLSTGEPAVAPDLDPAADTPRCLVGPASGPAAQPAVPATATGGAGANPIPDQDACGAAPVPDGTGTASLPVLTAGLPVGSASGAMPPAGVPPGSA